MAAHKKTFHLHEGKSFSSLKAFAKELKSMSDHSFLHHVNDTKNDFASWVKHSLKNEKLADSLERKIDRLEMELEVLRHLVHDQKKAASKPKKAASKAKKVVKKAKKK